MSILFLVLAVISFTVTTEDAYISFRYAENIAAGHGIVFNVGENVVEGYSNPTWVALLAIFSKLGLSTINAGRCLGLIFGALTLLEIVLLFSLVVKGGERYGYLAAIAVATAPPYLFWSQTGLENGLFLYLVMISWRLGVQEDRDRGRFPYSAISLFLLAVTRPEGIMYSIVFGAWKLAAILSNSGKESIKRLLLWSAIIIIPFGVFLIWRYSVFGALVPNTFFAKVNNGVRANLRVGTRYLLGFLNHILWAPVVIPVVIAIFRKGRLEGSARRVLLAAAMLAAVLFVFVLYVGGDIHPNDRFGVPFILFSVVASFVLAQGAKKGAWWKRASTWVLVAFVAANLGYSFPPAYGIEPPMSRPPNFLTANLAGLLTGRKTPGEILYRFANPPVDGLEFVGRDLKENPEIDGLLSAGQCGKIPYFSELPTLDLLGLNHPEIAHIVHSVSTWDLYATEVLSHLPETFVMVYRARHFISRYYIENTVLSEPFRRRYRLDAIYHIDYCFVDNVGVEHCFPFEMVRYRPVSEDALVPLSEEEIRWFTEHQPIVDTPDRLREEVEAFREENGEIVFRVDLN